MATSAVADWAQSREAGARWQFRLLLWLALHAPDRLTDPLLWLVSLVFACQARRPSTQASAAYLERILGRKARLRDRHRHALVFAQVYLDRVKLLSGGLEGFVVEVRGREMIAEAVAAGRGGVLLGAHFGSFEALRALDRALPGLRVHYLMYPEHARASSALLDGLNASVAERVISLQDSQQAMLKVVEALDRGDFVAFLGDRVLKRSERGQVEAPFLGEPIRLPTSPYVAAIAARVPLFFCTAPRSGKHRYAIEFSLLHDGAPVDRALRRARIDELARRYLEALEGMCRRHPHNWFNFFDIWRR
ncbi:MAG: hypothetical protein WD100_05495 [Tistlia sp.]